MFRHFITSIDYAKLIKMQANQTAPYEKAVDIKKTPKGKSNSKGYKVKTLGKRSKQGGNYGKC
jgi:hypothetical protein